ncbi:unnamed protein product, partial [Eretmochelys imbricata]
RNETSTPQNFPENGTSPFQPALIATPESSSVVGQVSQIYREWSDVKRHGLRNTNAYVLVYDICNPESFEYVKMIQQQIMENRAGGTREAPILVVGSKRDQQKQRFVPRGTLSALVKKSWKCGSMECSATFNGHIVLLFKEMLSSVLARAANTTTPLCASRGRCAQPDAASCETCCPPPPGGAPSALGVEWGRVGNWLPLAT